MRVSVWSFWNVACLDPARLESLGFLVTFCERAGERSLPSKKICQGVRPKTVCKGAGFPLPPFHTDCRIIRTLIEKGRDRDKLLTVVLLCLFCLPASAQDKTEPSHPTEPTITFDLFWEAAAPQNYTITVESSGKAKYVSRNPTRHEEGSEDASDPDYEVEFTMSPASRDQLFTLAKANNYFQGDFDYKHKVANTGRKTLTYADPARHFQTTYNFSVNKDIEQITRLFQGISNTIEYGRKLQFMRRFDKLSLDTELRGMEEMAQNGYLAEIQIIAPLLQNLANDTSVLHMARQRAQHLLASVSPPSNQVQ